MTKVILYSTNCPKCNVLTKKLNKKQIDYIENTSTEEMISLGITQVPMLKVGDKLLNFKESVDWINLQ